MQWQQHQLYLIDGHAYGAHLEELGVLGVSVRGHLQPSVGTALEYAPYPRAVVGVVAARRKGPETAPRGFKSRSRGEDSAVAHTEQMQV